MLLLMGGGLAANTPPVVSAGSDFGVYVGVPVGLGGSVTDDGLPSATLTSLWTQDSGPGTATFIDATSPTTNVSFDTVGSYVLRLTGDDGALTAFDTVTVTVSDPPSGGGGKDKWWYFLWR